MSQNVIRTQHGSRRAGMSQDEFGCDKSRTTHQDDSLSLLSRMCLKAVKIYLLCISYINVFAFHRKKKAFFIRI